MRGLGVAGIRSSLQKLQNLTSFLNGSSQYGHIRIKFLHNLQNLAPLFIGSSQYGHIKAVILTGGKSSNNPLCAEQKCNPFIA